MDTLISDLALDLGLFALDNGLESPGKLALFLKKRIAADDADDADDDLRRAG